MNKYILKLPYEFEAFQLGIELTIIQYESEDCFTKKDNNDEKTIEYNIEFQDEDQMYAFDKDLRESLPFIFVK